MPYALIVEDEPEANALLSMLIQLRGYRTVSAYTGGEALATIERDPPDVVFLDLMLPDINGYEVCKAVKTRRKTSLIPVVMVTARVAVENRIESYCIGADQYVPKPYTPDQIYQALDDACAWRRNVKDELAAGSIAYDTLDDGETLRHLAQLRSQMIAFTALAVDSACRVNESLRHLWAQADTWGQAHKIRHVATLQYRINADAIVLTLRDLCGWFRDDPRSPAERWPEEVARGRFDEIQVDRPAGEVSFVIRLSPGPPPAP